MAVSSALAGVILLCTGHVVQWVATGEAGSYEAQIVDVSALGTWLLAGGGLGVFVLLLLDAYVGPRHRREEGGRRATRPD